MTKDLADELERLDKGATPGEWRTTSSDSPFGQNWLGIEAGNFSVVVYGCEDDDAGVNGRTPEEAETNAALIVALRNALPQIISALRSLTGEGEPVAQDAKDAEITRLRADITGLEDGNMTFLCDQLDKAKAENARMREALEQIADGSAPPIPHGHYVAHRHAVNLARVALSVKAR